MQILLSVEQWDLKFERDFHKWTPSIKIGSLFSFIFDSFDKHFWSLFPKLNKIELGWFCGIHTSKLRKNYKKNAYWIMEGKSRQLLNIGLKVVSLFLRVY